MPHEAITPDLLLRAYATGIFPMAEGREDPALFWLEPDQRAIIPLAHFHAPRSLLKRIRQNPYRLSVDQDFSAVIKACSASKPDRPTTWISKRLEALYQALFEKGYAHSIECWQASDQGEKLVGGLFGVALAGAFFGESMFHTASNASKIALVYLVAHLKAGGYSLLDTQFTTEHLNQFGAAQIPRGEYKARLEAAMGSKADFYRLSSGAQPGEILRHITGSPAPLKNP